MLGLMWLLCCHVVNASMKSSEKWYLLINLNLNDFGKWEPPRNNHFDSFFSSIFYGKQYIDSRYPNKKIF